MTGKSKLFDNIRIKKRRSAEAPAPDFVKCDWEGCEKPGLHRAPKADRAGGGFHMFCLEHVRHYNKSFNYFSEMKDDEIAAEMRKAAQTGERPTWGMGANAHGRGNPKPREKAAPDFTARRVSDPHNLFARLARNQGRGSETAEVERRLVDSDRRALETLGLKGFQTSAKIKSTYKALVKQHHPDANGGDRKSEDRLRAIITAYTHLKQKGFV